MKSQYGGRTEDEKLLAGGGVDSRLLLLSVGGVGVVLLPLLSAGLTAPLVGPGQQLGLSEVIETSVDRALPGLGLVPE